MKPATLLGSVLLMLVTGTIPARAQVVRLEILSREPAAGDEILRGRIHGSRYPLLTRGELAPAKGRDLGFPQVPGLTFSDRVVNPVLDYDFGSDFIANDLSGILSRQPPTIKQVLPTLVPTVDADGHERVGVPSVLHQAPLGAYLGWNITGSGFFKGQGCGFAGGYWPFARTRAGRDATKDPRPSIAERYGTLDGYVCVVRRAAERAVRERFLLRADADRLIAAAAASAVLPASANSSAEAKAIAAGVCEPPTPPPPPAPASASAPPSGGAGSCEALSALTIPDVTISAAETVSAGTFQPETGRAVSVPAFCRVRAVATPSADSHISVEVWLPLADAWNGRFLGMGNGGFSGSIDYAAMAAAVGRGYATAGTDTGHVGDQLDFAQGHPDRIIDWAYRAIHVTAQIGKLVARDRYGRFPDHAYFRGCSTGGQQALSEAQRFPDDYEGIVAGDPGNNRIRLILGFLWGWQASHTPDGRPILTQANLDLLTRSAVQACDANDGLRDGIIGDPRACRFDPATLQCKDASDASCLTPAQVQAATKIYNGARRARTGEQIYPGWARGSEIGWRAYLTEPREPARIGFFRNFVFHDPNWDVRTFDWDRDVAYAESQVPFVEAMSLDYRGFKARGGKLLMYTGLADPVVPPEDPMSYYEAVARAAGGVAQTQTFFRFFPVPGMGHCGGGVGPNAFDALGTLEGWVEQGIAPSRIVAAQSTDGKITRTRPLCPYPRVARYRGSGSVDDAASFVCVPPPARKTR